MRIQTKIVSGQFLIIIGIIAMAIYAGYYEKQSLLHTTGKHSAMTAQHYLQDIYQRLFNRMDALRIYGQTPALQFHLKKSNFDYQIIAESPQDIVLINADTAGRHSVTTSEISRQLRDRFIDAYHQMHGVAYLERVFVTNRYGKIVAQTHPSEGYRLKKDQDWWFNVKEKGYHIVNWSAPESGTVMDIEVAVRINDTHGRFAGVITGAISLSAIVTAGQFFENPFSATEFHLFTKGGKSHQNKAEIITIPKNR